MEKSNVACMETGRKRIKENKRVKEMLDMWRHEKEQEENERKEEWNKGMQQMW